MNPIVAFARSLTGRTRTTPPNGLEQTRKRLQEALSKIRDPLHSRKIEFNDLIATISSSLEATRVRARGEHHISKSGPAPIILKNDSTHPAQTVRELCLRLELFGIFHRDIYRAAYLLARFGIQPKDSTQQLLLELHDLGTNRVVDDGQRADSVRLKTTLNPPVKDVLLASTDAGLEGPHFHLEWVNPEACA